MALKRLEKTGLLLPDILASFVEELVAKGEYMTEGEVILAALWEMRQRSISPEQAKEELRQEIQKGVDDIRAGRFLTLEEFKAKFETRTNYKRKQE